MMRMIVRPRAQDHRWNARLRRVLMTADTVGGVWHYALALSRSLTERGIEVVLATMGARLSPDQRMETEQIDGLRVYDSAFRLEWMIDPWPDVYAAGEWLLEIAAREHPDVIHLNNFTHGDLPWERPVLMVGHSCVHSWFAAVRDSVPPPEWDTYRKRVAGGLAAATLVVAPTRAMLASLRRHYDVRFDGLHISNGMTQHEYRVGRKEPLVFAAGRVWDEAKNLSMLDAVAPALDWPVYIAGSLDHPDGGTLSVGNALALGLLGRADMRRWFSRAAIYALPARYEPFGLSALEAGLSGCALILGDIPTLREIWGDAAVFVDPRDAESLEHAVRALISDEERRTDLARRATARARLFSTERMTRSYLSAYDRLLRGRPTAIPMNPRTASRRSTPAVAARTS